MKCSYCQKPVEHKLNPKVKNHFCSRSCAASYNNSVNPKRVKTIYTCQTCGDVVSTARAKQCRACIMKNGTSEQVKTTTVGQLKELYKDKNALAFAAKIRGYGKTIYNNSNDPKYCVVCGYNKHYEVCHIKSISSFSDDATMAQVHNINNLVALCRNHHWEFDNNILTLNVLLDITGKKLFF